MKKEIDFFRLFLRIQKTILNKASPNLEQNMCKHFKMYMKKKK